MQTEELVDIFRKGGYKIKKTGGYYFYRQGLIIYSFPQLYNMPANTMSLKSLRWKALVTVIKTELPTKNVNEFILSTDNYDIEQFGLRKVRNIIRKSLKECDFKRPSLEDLIEFGLRINKLTVERHGRKDRHSTNTELWKRFVCSVYYCDNVHILGAYVDRQMVGYIMAFKHLDRFFLYNPYYDMNYSCSAPMNGLIYTLVNQLLALEKPVRISYGLESFSPNPGLDRFKTNMQFQKKSTSRLYIINPILIAPIRFWLWLNIHLLKKKTFSGSISKKIIRLYQGHRLYTRMAEKMSLLTS